MNIAQLAKTRYTTKAFDPARKISDAVIDEIRTLLRYSPSSVNSQPWHFVIAGTDEGKARVAKATQTGFAYNTPKLLNASHVVVFCARTGIDESHLAQVLGSEEKDGRFTSADAKAGQNNTRGFYVNLHRYDQKDLQHWIEKQVYLSLGTVLLGAAALGIDACPMEGFDARILDEELGLRSQGLSAVAMVALGYRSTEDFNAKLPKSRLPAKSVLTEI